MVLPEGVRGSRGLSGTSRARCSGAQAPPASASETRTGSSQKPVDASLGRCHRDAAGCQVPGPCFSTDKSLAFLPRQSLPRGLGQKQDKGFSSMRDTQPGAEICPGPRVQAVGGERGLRQARPCWPRGTADGWRRWRWELAEPGAMFSFLNRSGCLGWVSSLVFTAWAATSMTVTACVRTRAFPYRCLLGARPFCRGVRSHWGCRLWASGLSGKGSGHRCGSCSPSEQG